MACPKTTLSIDDCCDELRATFEGSLGRDAARMLRQLIAKMREKPRRLVVLDVSRAESIEESGLEGLDEVEQAAEEMEIPFELRAQGPRASELLAGAGLARALRRGRGRPT